LHQLDKYFNDVSNLPDEAKKELDLFIEFLKFKFL